MENNVIMVRSAGAVGNLPSPLVSTSCSMEGSTSIGNITNGNQYVWKGTLLLEGLLHNKYE